MARTRPPGDRRPRRDRRRSGAERDPGSLSPVMGKAAACATVLVYVWCIFMVLANILFSYRLETGTLAAYMRMHDAWAVAALLMLLFVGVDLVGRVTAFRARGRALLAVDILTVVVLTMMLVVNIQFANLYGRLYWDRVYPYVPWHAVRGDFQYPPSRVPGSTANQEWQDFQQFLLFRMRGDVTVGLEFGGAQPVRHLAQCTTDLWIAQYEELYIRVGDGPEHRLRPPASSGWSRHGLVLPPEDGSLDGLVLVDDLEPGVRGWEDRGHMPPQLDPRELVYPAGSRRAERLEEVIRDASRRYRPLPLLVPRDASMEWLDALLRRLEERGVRWFALTFYG